MDKQSTIMIIFLIIVIGFATIYFSQGNGRLAVLNDICKSEGYTEFWQGSYGNDYSIICRDEHGESKGLLIFQQDDCDEDRYIGDLSYWNVSCSGYDYHNYR